MYYKVYHKSIWSDPWGVAVFSTDVLERALDRAELFEDEGNYAMIELPNGDRVDSAGYPVEE